MKSAIQHRLNPLHLYCLLIKWGVDKQIALRVCMSLEPVVKVLIYK